MSSTREHLKARLLENPAALADRVIDALTAAGAYPDWDSETIENVLTPLQGYVVDLGFPPVGSEGPDGEYTEFWVGVENGDVEHEDEYEPVVVDGVTVAESRHVDL